MDSYENPSTLIVTIALEGLLFLGIGLWRFSREEL
jgi:hypothetical protein